MGTESMQDHLVAIEADRAVFVAEHGEGTEELYNTALTELSELHVRRKQDTTNFALYNLPQLPENRVEIYERIRDAEQRYVNPTLDKKGYVDGAATVPDERLVVEGLSGVLLTAEHATQQMRLQKDGSRKPKDADQGTGGLGWVVREDTDSSLILPMGLQTGDGNDDIEHWIKDEMRRQINERSVGSHISLHSISRTLVGSLVDLRSYNVMIGIGNEPNDHTSDMAKRIKEIARGYDLRVGINEGFIAMESNAPPRPQRKDDGSMKMTTFAAAGAGRSRRASEVMASESGDTDFAAVQLEMSTVLTYQPEDLKSYPGKESQLIGVHIGYLFARDCVKLLAAKA